MDGEKRVGYWSGEQPPDSLVDLTWDRTERKAVVAYLLSGKIKDRWRGGARCRICDAPNGSTCLTDGVYVWPEGFAHYVEEHDVKPPQDFIDHVFAAMS